MQHSHLHATAISGILHNWQLDSGQCRTAPLHEPYNLAPIKAAFDAHADIPQVACFDTSFHRTNPEVAQTYALPIELREQGIRRYGFHGLSYEYIASVLPKIAPNIADGRVVVMHLGNGASGCALLARVSIASTMGFTAVEGLPMGTRSGELDPGVVLHLAMQRGMSMHDIQDLLYKNSGMLGLSGISADFRDLLASSDPHASFAVDFFCYRVARHIGSLAAALGGLDGLVFTAGVGEHAAPVRAKICHLCSWLGVELDEAANEHQGPCISRNTSHTSRTEAWVIPTNEERMIARHTQALL
jgi:acetate kinase